MLVLVLGLPGSGKSFFAEKLAASLSSVYLNSDRIRKEMGAFGKYTDADKLVVYHEMFRLAEEKILLNNNVVLDATFSKEETRSFAKALSARMSIPIFWILVYADEGLIKERLSKKRFDSEADFGVYEKIRDNFQPFNDPHLLLRSTNANIKDMLDQAHKYIEEKDE